MSGWTNETKSDSGARLAGSLEPNLEYNMQRWTMGETQADQRKAKP